MQSVFSFGLRYSFLFRFCCMVAASSTLVACSLVPKLSPTKEPSPSAPSTSSSSSDKQTSSNPAAHPIAFRRPAQGPVLTHFDGNLNKGIDIEGVLGDPIVAAADGRVVVITDELHHYGTMIIVQHDGGFLTAYAHTQNVLVREKETVNRGQRIAEMGNTGTERPKLHFEVRREGVAVNPEPYFQKE